MRSQELCAPLAEPFPAPPIAGVGHRRPARKPCPPPSRRLFFLRRRPPAAPVCAGRERPPYHSRRRRNLAPGGAGGGGVRRDKATARTTADIALTARWSCEVGRPHTGPPRKGTSSAGRQGSGRGGAAMTSPACDHTRPTGLPCAQRARFLSLAVRSARMWAAVAASRVHGKEDPS